MFLFSIYSYFYVYYIFSTKQATINPFLLLCHAYYHFCRLITFLFYILANPLIYNDLCVYLRVISCITFIDSAFLSLFSSNFSFYVSHLYIIVSNIYVLFFKHICKVFLIISHFLLYTVLFLFHDLFISYIFYLMSLSLLSRCISRLLPALQLFYNIFKNFITFPN